MLLWEALSNPSPQRHGTETSTQPTPARTMRLPYDKRCAASTKAGTRCRGRIHKDGDYCLFHDPVMIAKRRAATPSNASKKRRRLSHLPDGYLRKLSNRASVGSAMDRLYREIRLGILTPEMGRVMFDILTRLLDSELVTSGKCPQRSKANRLRPKLSDLLTRREKLAWRRAVDHADRSSRKGTGRSRPQRPAQRIVDQTTAAPVATEREAPLVFQAAS